MIRVHKASIQDHWKWAQRIEAKFSADFERLFFAWAGDIASALNDHGEFTDRGMKQAQQKFVDRWRLAVRPLLTAGADNALKTIRRFSVRKDAFSDMGDAILVDNPYVVEWLESHGAEHVTEMGIEAQQALREVIKRGIADHKTMRQIAGELKGNPKLLGLRTDQRLAAQRAYDRWTAEGLSEEIAAKRLERYSYQLLGQRALLVSRTESMRALNQGAQAAYSEAKDRGLLLPQTKRMWIASPGSPRTCDICEGLHRQKVDIDEPWEFDGEEYDEPPAHPACRCTTGLVTSL